MSVAFPPFQPDWPIPSDDAAEEALLAAVLLWPHTLQAALDAIPHAGVFRKHLHSLTWAAITAIASRGQAVDFVTVKGELTRTGALAESEIGAYARLIDGRVRTSAIDDYAADVIDAHRLRQVQDVAWLLVKRAGERAGRADEILADAERSLRELSAGQTKTQVIAPPEVGGMVVQHMERALNDGGMRGVPSGFPDLDRLCMGWQPGELAIIAGRTSMGKTSFALASAWHAAAAGESVLFVSMEMAATDIALRVACIEARLSFHSVRSGRLTEVETRRLLQAIGAIERSGFAIDDRARNVHDIRNSVRTLVNGASKVGLIVVDYLQLMTPSPRAGRTRGDVSRVREIGEMTGDLKALAKEHHCAVICLSQLSRKCEERSDKRPLLSDLRDSGEIEQDADLVGFVFRPAKYGDGPENEGEFIVAKNRNGACASVDLEWDGPSMRYAQRSSYAVGA